jgi:predicted MPP superfamily phosphohydrolase
MKSYWEKKLERLVEEGVHIYDRLQEVFTQKSLLDQIPSLKEEPVSFPSTRWTLPSLKVAMASDFHWGSAGFSLSNLRDVVRRLNKSGADIILLGGDFLNNYHKYNGGCGDAEEIAAILGELKAPLGVFAVLGNHDWDNDPEGIKIGPALKKNGIAVLENDAVRLVHQGEKFWLVGVGDHSTGHEDLTKAFAKTSGGSPIIALAHNPSSIEKMPLNPVITFSGHTHGAQFELPIIGKWFKPVPACARGLVHGLVEKWGRCVYISAGLGNSLVPWRTVAPEIVIFTLRPAEALVTAMDEALVHAEI